MTYGVTINLQYYSILDKSWHQLKDLDSKSSILGNRKIYTRYFKLGYIRRAR